MKGRRPRWSHVTIALALIAAIAIASPVFGVSKSIKKAIKKEVAKQIDDATGPQGPQGSKGDTGAQGAPGPTAAGVYDGLPDPVANPEDMAFAPTATVNAPSSGRILATWFPPGSDGISVTCTAGDPNVGLYVDGVPLPDSGASLVSGVAQDVSLTGISAVVAPGNHVVEIGMDCPTGNLMATAFRNHGLVGLLLGG